MSVPPLKTLHESLLIPLCWAFANFPKIGKTTLAKVLASSFRPAAVYLDLELPSDLARLEEPELYLTLLHDRQVIIDEIQRMPSLFPVLWALVDLDIEAFPVKDLQYLMERD